MSAALNALTVSLGQGEIVVERAASRPWASAGADGERHRLEVTVPDDSADSMLSHLSDREFALDGYFVADIAAVAVERRGCEARLVIEALTIALD